MWLCENDASLTRPKQVNEATNTLQHTRQPSLSGSLRTHLMIARPNNEQWRGNHHVSCTCNEPNKCPKVRLSVVLELDSRTPTTRRQRCQAGRTFRSKHTHTHTHFRAETGFGLQVGQKRLSVKNEPLHCQRLVGASKVEPNTARHLYNLNSRFSISILILMATVCVHWPLGRPLLLHCT